MVFNGEFNASSFPPCSPVDRCRTHRRPAYSPTGAGNWNDPANWANVPALSAYPNNGGGNSFTATVSGIDSTGTQLSLSSNIGLSGLNFQNAALVGTASDSTTVQASPLAVTVNGPFNGGDFALNRGAVLNLAGNSIATGHNITGDPNAVLNIAPGGIFTPTSTLFLSVPTNVNGTMYATGSGELINFNVPGTHSGTFQVSSGATINAAGTFTTSSVVYDSATFDLAGTGTVFNGTLNVAAGATLQVDGNTNVSSAAIVNFSAGANLGNAVSAQGVVFNNNQVMNINNANLAGSITFHNAGASFNTLTYGVGTGADQLTLETGGTINIGTLTVNGNTTTTGIGGPHATTLSVGTFNLSGGIFRGNANVTSTMNFTAGNLDGGDGTETTVNIQSGNGKRHRRRWFFCE